MRIPDVIIKGQSTHQTYIPKKRVHTRLPHLRIGSIKDFHTRGQGIFADFMPEVRLHTRLILKSKEDTGNTRLPHLQTGYMSTLEEGVHTKYSFLQIKYILNVYTTVQGTHQV